MLGLPLLGTPKMPRTRSKGVLPPTVQSKRGVSYVVQWVTRGCFFADDEYDHREMYPDGGVYPSYDLAIRAIRDTISENKLDGGTVDWDEFVLIVHANDTLTLGVPDAVRMFTKEGVPYVPKHIPTDETRTARLV